MTLICLLLVIALEFHFKLGGEYRNFSWFKKLIELLNDSLGDKGFYESWGGVAIILLTPVLLIYGFLHLFDGSIYWLVLFVLSFAILFLSIGPKSLADSFAHYFEAMSHDDPEAAYLHIKTLASTPNLDRHDSQQPSELDVSENDELVRSTTRLILVESQKRYFGVIAWFILLGPLAALFYRLAHLYQAECEKLEFDEHLPLMDAVIHWIDWLPARITSMLFLLTGDFVNGFYRIQDYLTDADADNNQLISETGIAALGLEMGVSDGDVEENHRTMDMVNRTVVFYLVLGAIVGVII